MYNDEVIKVAIFGAPESGKSRLADSLMCDTCEIPYNPTVGAMNYWCQSESDFAPIRAICDIGTNARFNQVPQRYLIDSDFIIVVVNNSFIQTKKYIGIAKSYITNIKNIYLYTWDTTIDLQKLAKKHGVSYLRSCKLTNLSEHQSDAKL